MSHTVDIMWPDRQKLCVRTIDTVLHAGGIFRIPDGWCCRQFPTIRNLSGTTTQSISAPLAGRMLRGGRTSNRLSTPDWKPPRQSGCFIHCGNMAVRSYSLTAGMNGNVRKPAGSAATSVARMGNLCLWRRLGHTLFGRSDENEGFVIVTATADKGLIDIQDRRRRVLPPEYARIWLRQERGVTGPKIRRSQEAYPPMHLSGIR